MEKGPILDNSINSDSGLTSRDFYNLEKAAKWARFLGIVGFVFSGIMLLGAIFSIFAFGSMPNELGVLGMGGSMRMMGIFYLIFLAPYFLISLYLYRFGSNILEAGNGSNQELLSRGILELKNFFTLSGILVAILLALYVLLLIVALGVGVSM